MKKLILAITVMLLFSALSQAQDSTRKHSKTTKAVVEKKSGGESKTVASKKVSNPSEQKTSTSTGTTVKTQNATVLKKDGAPDKRFKANKTKPEVAHLKKNGTADKRYKENKKAVNQ